MKIIVGDIYSEIISKDARTLALVRSICRARPAGYMHMPRYRAGRWDGYISLMSGFRKFPSGLLDIVVAGLEKRHYTVDIEKSVFSADALVQATLSPTMLEGIELREYQLEAVERLLAGTRGIAKMATNSGKTEVMAAIISILGMPTVVLVHRKELMYQTAARFRQRMRCDTVGMVGDGIDSPDFITVAMIQTMYNSMVYINEPVPGYHKNAVLMIDECHHASSDQFMDVINNLPGHYRFGFSGTPLKYDVLADMKLIGATGPVLVDISNDYLIRGGYSVPPLVHVHDVYSDDSALWEMTYQEAYDSCVVDNATRNALISKLAIESAGVVLVLVRYIRHGNALQKQIPGSVFVHGSCTTEERSVVLERMRFGNAGTYIASTIFDEGIDVPSVDTLILAGGGKSNIKLLQRVGRGLRTSAGKSKLVVHDFVDDTNHHLLSHSEERIRVYESEGFQISSEG